MTARNLALEALKGAASLIERSICAHDETKRGGAIWEICCSCGAKWADDEGGKPEYKEPEELIAVYTAIAALEAETGEPVATVSISHFRGCSGMEKVDIQLSQYLPEGTHQLYTAPPPAVPPGWKLVPIEPTEAMWKAGLAHLFRDVDAVWKAMLAEVPEATGSAVSQWLSIETAPKTSKAILVHCAERKNTYTATWARDEEFPWSGKWKHFSGDFISEVATHWQPLPEAPK